MEQFNYTTYLDKLEEKLGYYQLNVNSVSELFDLVRPDKPYNLLTLFEENYKSISKVKLKGINFISCIFRGVSDSQYLLTPTLYRNIGLEDYNFLPKNYSELQILKEFVYACDLSATQIPNDSLKLRKLIKDIDYFIKSVKENQNEWLIDDFYELTAFAQHYGVPTRLLDWSNQALVSLYFASIGAIKTIFESNDQNNVTEKYFSLWVYSPIFHVDPETNKNYNEEIKIVDIPKSINQHVSFQRGCFIAIKQKKGESLVDNLFVGNKNLDIDDKFQHLNDKLLEYNLSSNLIKINIPYELALEVYDLCNSFNFNSATLFRGPHGGGQYVNETRIVEYIRNQKFASKRTKGA